MAQKFSANVSFEATPELNMDYMAYKCVYEVKWPNNPREIIYVGRGRTKADAAQDAMAKIIERLYF